jgi:microcystin-dependent protein
MGDQYLGEIRIFSFNFPPKDWAFCNGQILSIQQNAALFSLLGTSYGGNGQTTFALPNLQSRVPIHMGQGSGLSGYTLGQIGGVEAVTVDSSQMPAHTHIASASSATANTTTASGNLLGDVASPATVYGPPGALTTLASGSIGTAGNSQPHENRQPYLALNFCIALFGIFPSRS